MNLQSTKDKYKYSITDHLDGELLAYCKKIYGLSGDKQIFDINNTRKHCIEIIGTIANNKLYNYLIEGKDIASIKNMSLVSINVIDREKNKIGSYNLSVHEFRNIRPALTQKNEFNFEIIGLIADPALESEMKLWDLLYEGKPNQVGIWHSMSYPDRRAWLNIVKNYFWNSNNLVEKEIRRNGCFEINGNHIIDYSSFFLEVGEAIGGPCGYFGSDLSSFEDFIFGISVRNFSFTLIWKNFEVSKRYLDENSIIMEFYDFAANSVRCLNTFGQIPEIEDIRPIDNKSMFEIIINLLIEKGIKVKLISAG